MEEDCECGVVIVGGGIAGLATALALKRVGVASLVLERSAELRATGAALTLFPNAWRALDALGVARKLTSVYPAFHAGTVTDVATGAVQRVSYAGTWDREGVGLRSVHRSELLKALAEELPASSIRFSSKVVSITTETVKISPIHVLQIDDGAVIKAKVREYIPRFPRCDGVHSVIAKWLGLSAPVHSGRAGVRGLAVFPDGHGLKHEVQQFVGNGFRAGLIPLTHQDIYWFITYKSSLQGQEGPRDPELIQKDVMENLARDLPQAYMNVVQHCDLATLTWAPLMFRYPWDVLFGPTCNGAVVVAGDAMHPMTPDVGQGGCSALEDAVVLGQHIGNSLLRYGELEPDSVKQAFKGYVKERKWRVAGLIARAYIFGWVQLAGSGWLSTFIRDKIFYGLFYNKLTEVAYYDCGTLPSVSSAGYKQD
ncbi:hypothetical protein ACLOJK_033284 [Asimina triloba]